MAEKWYYVKGKQRCGPVAREQIEQALSSGEIANDTLVWTEGMAQWTPAAGVEGMVATEPDEPAVPPEAVSESPVVEPESPDAGPSESREEPAFEAPPRTRPQPAAPPKRRAPVPAARPAASPAAPSAEDEDFEDQPAGMSQQMKIAIIAGAGAGSFVLIMLVVWAVFLSGQSSTGDTADRPAASQAGSQSTAKKKPPPPQEVVQVAALDPATLSDAEKQFYEEGRKQGRGIGTAFLKEHKDKPSAKAIKDALHDRDVAIHIAAKSGLKNEDALKAYGRRDGLKDLLSERKISSE